VAKHYSRLEWIRAQRRHLSGPGSPASHVFEGWGRGTTLTFDVTKSKMLPSKTFSLLILYNLYNPIC